MFRFDVSRRGFCAMTVYRLEREKLNVPVQFLHLLQEQKKRKICISTADGKPVPVVAGMVEEVLSRRPQRTQTIRKFAVFLAYRGSALRRRKLGGNLRGCEIMLQLDIGLLR